ncbi:MAG: ATP-binding cassette domain-containing protein, partial [Paracoccaceae bacterium]|nr:ATP-binding cassette domain-containing protein [Paracoccaceae bacterium]
MIDHNKLDVLNLSLFLGQLEILHRVNLSLRSGEIVAITGETGSGKSMTALAVMGLLPTGMQVSGQILLDGVDMLALSEPQMCALRGNHIGMIFQEPMTALNPLKTIGDQVLETILIHRKSSKATARARAQEVLIRVGLPPEEFALSRYPHQLSGGQRQRVVIAMAIALRPKFLIADEPTTALDVTTQAQILVLLKDLVRQEGMGLMIITHDLAVVSDLADQILIMRQGEVVEQGPTGQLFAVMAHPYTRMLFEASNHSVSLPTSVVDPAPLLQVENVTRSYQLPRSGFFSKPNILRAVDNVSFTLHAGERMGLVGESGCGKSTLTRAILGLEQVQAGTITLKGGPVWAGRQPNRAVRRNIQVVFQDPYGSFNPRHPVARLITEPYHLLDHLPNT